MAHNIEGEKGGKEKGYNIQIDHKPFSWPERYITGAQLKDLVKVDKMTYGVWLKVEGPGDDILIGNDEKVDLSEKGKEHFFTGKTQTTEG